MSQQLIEQFFHSKSGQEFQRELSDENIAERQHLIDENENFKNQMGELLSAKKLIEAKERLERAENELKDARAYLSSICSAQYQEKTRLEKAIQKNEQELLKTSPNYVTVCFESIRKYFPDGAVLGVEKSNLLSGFLNEINSWSLMALPYDGMKTRFNEMVSSINRSE